MKKIILASFAVIFAFASCQKNEIVAPGTYQIKTINFTIGANVAGVESKTAIAYNSGESKYTPSWSANDTVGFYFNTISTPAYLVNTTAGATASFEGTVDASVTTGSNTVYGFYPKSMFNAVDDAANKKVIFWIPEYQTVSADSFDPAADLLLAKADFNYTAGNSVTVSNVTFKRQLAVIKLIITNTDALLATDVVSAIKLSSNTAKLAGMYTADLSTSQGTIDNTYYTQSITATLATPTVLGESLVVYLLVNPTTITSGSTLDVDITTDKHAICRKSIAVASDLTLTAGHVKPITFAFPDATSDLYLYSNSPESAMKMTNLGNNKFTWEGMIEGSTSAFLTAFKFCTDKNSYWSGYFRSTQGSSYWAIAHYWEAENMYDMSSQGFGVGEYTINADLTADMAEIIPHVWINGGNTTAGWDRATAFPMTYQGNGILTYEGWFWGGSGGIQLNTNNSLSYNTLYNTTKTSDNSWSVSASTGGMASLNDYSLGDGNYRLTLDVINWTLTIEAL